LGAQAAFCGSRLWEEQYPDVARALWALSEGHGKQDPTFRTVLSYTRLTAAKALKQLRAQGFPEDQLPSPTQHAGGSSESQRSPFEQDAQGQAPRKLPETGAIIANLAEEDGKPLAQVNPNDEGPQIKRLSIDCKATVKIGEYVPAENPWRLPGRRPR
jgi:hypothetical protein